MYARRLKGKEFTFDFAEGLLENNLLIADRETDSLWSQLDGRAVSGPMRGTPLEALPAMQTTWKFWREKHPQTRVMVAEGKQGRPYFYRDRKPGTPPPPQPPNRHDISTLGLGVSLGGEAVFFPFRELERAPSPLKYRLGGQEISIHFAGEGLTAWAEDASGQLLFSVLAYEDGWLAFNPRSSLFRASSYPR